MPRLPRTVVVLGLASLAMDLSSEAIHAVLPLFVTGTLGLSAAWLGVVEGLGQGVALVTRLLSGRLSDRVARRKPLIVAGYGLATAAKPLFALAGGAASILTARLIDRLGKGLRGAPRNALIADVTAADARGAAYGLRESLDSLGAVAGPLAAAALLAWGLGLRELIWLAGLPAGIAVLLVVFGLVERSRSNPTRVATPWRGLIRPLAPVLVLTALFWLARFSEAFVILRAPDAGLSTATTPLVLAATMACYALVAYPAGRWADAAGPRVPLALSLVVLFGAHLALADVSDPRRLWLGALGWGTHLGLAEGTLSALVASFAPTRARGSAFGLAGFVGGVSAALASLIAGWAWSAFGAAVPFLLGAALAAVALVWLALMPRPQSSSTAKPVV